MPSASIQETRASRSYFSGNRSSFIRELSGGSSTGDEDEDVERQPNDAGALLVKLLLTFIPKTLQFDSSLETSMFERPFVGAWMHTK